MSSILIYYQLSKSSYLILDNQVPKVLGGYFIWYSSIQQGHNMEDHWRNSDKELDISNNTKYLREVEGLEEIKRKIDETTNLVRTTISC